MPGQSRRIFRRTTAALAAVAAVVAVTALGGATARAGGHPARTWTVQVGSEAEHMALQGMRFLPGDVTIDEGDTVTWVARAAEIHTVTFFPGGKPMTTLPGFNPGDVSQLTQQGDNTYNDPQNLHSSGLMTNVPDNEDIGPLPPVPHVHSYSLTFPEEGTWTYYCWVHGKVMVGVVHVQSKGEPYPYTQQQYNDQARIARAGLKAIGDNLRSQLRQQASNHQVFTGGDNGQVMLMRFVRERVRIHVGETVDFANTGMGAPHTVTFGTEPPPPGLFGPSGDPAHFAGGDLNSGILEPGSHFAVTFTQAGTYHYICALHDGMGMEGDVVVRP